MLRDYAVSLTLVVLVLLGYTALLFSKKVETQPTSSRVEASIKPKADLTQPPVSHD